MSLSVIITKVYTKRSNKKRHTDTHVGMFFNIWSLSNLKKTELLYCTCRQVQSLKGVNVVKIVKHLYDITWIGKYLKTLDLSSAKSNNISRESISE